MIIRMAHDIFSEPGFGDRDSVPNQDHALQAEPLSDLEDVAFQGLGIGHVAIEDFHADGATLGS